MPLMQLCDVVDDYCTLYEENHFIVNHVRVSSLSCLYLLAWCIGKIEPRAVLCGRQELCCNLRLRRNVTTSKLYLVLSSLPDDQSTR